MLSEGAIKALLHNFMPLLVSSVSPDISDFAGFHDVDNLFKEGLRLKQALQDQLFQKIPFVRKIQENSEGLLRYDTPDIIKKDKFAWLRDDEFARQTLAGINPVNIERLQAFPPTSKLDPAVYGPPESAITEDHIIGQLDGMSVQAMAEAVQHGIVASMEELFVTSKVWCTQCHPELVLPSLRESLLNLQLEYVDLYLVHWPMAVKPSKPHFPMRREDIVPMDLHGVWQAMEECHRLGLAKMIGVSNFTTKKLQELLAIAKISPAINQVELNPSWQQKKLIEFCKNKGIHVAAYSPLGGQRITDMNPVRHSDVLEEIAKARGKSVAQV
ncbi:hypothetical protein PR202_gb15501 [Eleusine coracana subsp. coracana]|uniref:Lipoxygenase domain-containing protein n=1 Tax=Eleusine coracana subsp. coracana TaxID=191504 RepID=A0AAV5EYE6_ELECO|nr:hypothetical protein PR202_gb15501 [Eleusine coracana subsp. coracana]